MTIIYTWKVKYLKEDERGYASTLHCELQGVDGTKTANSSGSISFGGDDYKPKSEWQQDQIDAFAESIKPQLQESIIEQLNKG